MNGGRVPRLSIGLPVFNGQQFLVETLDALLGQTYGEFELIISDNASTDATEAICRAYASRDPRVRYERMLRNLGPAANFNRLVDLARGPCFKWAAHDDLHHPNFIEKCLALLDAEPGCVLAYSRAVTIDANGKQVKRPWGGSPALGSDDAAKRLAELLAPPRDPIPLPMFGVIRTEVLKKVDHLGSYPECDRAMVAELALHGAFREVPEALFLQREHPGRVGNQMSRDPWAAAGFWGPAAVQGPLLPHWRLLRRLLRGVRRAPLPARDRRRCYVALQDWLWRHRFRLGRDLVAACERTPIIGAAVSRGAARLAILRWRAETRRALREVAMHIPPEAHVVLADEGAFAIDRIGSRKVVPFLEREGVYWGAPPDDASAISELERLRAAGASYFVVACPAFWWLNYYDEFRDHLDSHFRRIDSNRQVVIYDLDAGPGRGEAPGAAAPPAASAAADRRRPSETSGGSSLLAQ
jgi:glycosyltransferase involved in cell wall biosynthesis